MFESITKKRKNPWINYFGWTLLGVCCLVFVFMMDFNQGVLGTTGAAAEVNGDAISFKTFADLVDRMENSGNGSGASAEDQQRIRRTAIDMLVNQQLVMQKSKELNIFVSDNEVADFLMNIDGFREDGRFSRLKYKTYLSQSRQNEEIFETMIRKMLLERKMLGLMKHVSSEIPLVAETEKQLGQAKINISYLAFNKFNSTTLASPATAEVASFVKDDMAKVEKYYNDNKEEFFEKEKSKARHILIKFDANKEGDEKTAKEKASKILSETTLKNFSDMAKKHSEDPGSKVRGGDLGFFAKGQMVPEFEKVAFESEIGKISELVKSKFGFHIILVDERKTAMQKELKAVQDQIATNLIRDSKFEELASQMEAALKANEMDKIEALAKTNGLKWKDTGLFSINEDFIPGVGRVKEFMDGAMLLSASQPISRNLVHYQMNRYIMKLKDAKIDKDSKPKANDQMAFFKKMMQEQRANIVLKTWVDSLKKTADVKINPRILN